MKLSSLIAETLLLILFGSFLALCPIRSGSVGYQQGKHLSHVGVQKRIASETSGKARCRQEEHFFQGLPTSYWREKALEFDQQCQNPGAIFVVVNPDGSFDTRKPDFRAFEGDPAALAVLLDLLRDLDPGVKRSACAGLKEIGAPAASSASALIEVLIREKSSLRQHAAEALGKIGVAAVPLLLHKLPSDSRTESAIFLALGQIGPDAAPAIPVLSAMINDKDRWEAAISTLGHIGPPSVPTLLSALESSNRQVRWRAALALQDTHDDPEILVPIFVKLLKDDDSVVRQAAAGGLRHPGSAAPKAVPALIEALKDPAGYTRREAIDSLGWIGRDAQAAVPILTRMLQEETDGYMCGCIRRALKNINKNRPRDTYFFVQ